MQKNTFLTKALILAVSALLVSACSSKGDTQEGEMQETAVEQTQEQAQEQEMKIEDDAALREQAERAKQALLEKSTFYFDFDQSSIKEDDQSILRAHAEYLANTPSASVVVEGNTDERGTVEYNLALGERRAAEIRRFLLANGAAAEQVETVSYGEERPAVTGTDDSAYAQNRRAVIVYQGEI